jgi:hypothetical protein
MGGLLPSCQFMRGRIITGLVAGLVLFTWARPGFAQADLLIYTDRLNNGFRNWSWASNNTDNASPVHSGTRSASVSANYWEAFSVFHPDYDATLYSNLVFWANGGASSGQILQLIVEFNGGSSSPIQLTALPANSWQQFVYSLNDLGVADKTNLTRITLQLTDSGTSGAFYLDDIKLTARPAPAVVHLGVNAAQAIRTVDARWFGGNAAIWDSSFDSIVTPIVLKDMGMLVLRYPGGSRSDDYHWFNNKSVTDNLTWATAFNNFVHVATNLGAQAFITVNYGTGTATEAANWVRNANVTNHLGFKYWEVGNELYGSWEVDSNAVPHDPYTYGVRAVDYIQQMKAADPTVKVGVVAVTGEDNYANYTTHPATNPRTGQVHNGWTPVMLTTMKNLGVLPDFIIHHVYPQNSSGESDPLLLQSAKIWPTDAADLRQQLQDYLGAQHTNVELICTENNSISSGVGKQTVSLVNALYLADSFGQLSKTEFNGLVWWAIRNGQETTGNNDPTLYGWRTNGSGQFLGDCGMLIGASTRYPAAYAAKLLQFLARPGDTVIGAVSDYQLLSTYAVRGTNGSLGVLVINKDAAATFNAQIAVAGFSPHSNAVLRSYGIPQDSAAKSGIGPQDIATTAFAGAGTNFNYSFPPYSLTLFALSPSGPKLVAMPSVPGQVVFQLQGQSSVPYVLQSSSNLSTWISVKTNTLAGSSQNFTNAMPPAGLQFWRAVWLP